MIDTSILKQGYINNIQSNIKTYGKNSNNSLLIGNNSTNYKKYDKNLLNDLLKIISHGDAIYYDRGIRKLQSNEIKKVFTNENEYYDKRKKNAYIKLLLDLKEIEYSERNLSDYLGTNRSTFKFYRIDPRSQSTFKVTILKNASLRDKRIFYEEIDLKHLNNKVNLKFKAEDCFYSISGKLKLPNLSKGEILSFKKCFIPYLLNECSKKLKKKYITHSLFLEKTLQKEKTKPSLYKDMMLIPTSHAELMREVRERELKYIRKIGLYDYHNIKIRIKVKKDHDQTIESSSLREVIISKVGREDDLSIVDIIVKRGIVGAVVGGLVEWWRKAKPRVCAALGVAVEDIESVDIGSGEVACLTLAGERVGDTGIPELDRRNDNKRDLIAYGFHGYSEYVDYSGGYPEYEVRFTNVEHLSVEALAEQEHDLMHVEYTNKQKEEIIHTVLDECGIGNAIMKWIRRIKKMRVIKKADPEYWVKFFKVEVIIAIDRENNAIRIIIIIEIIIVYLANIPPIKEIPIMELPNLDRG